MTRMTAHLRVTGAAVAASALLSLWAAEPALAHGAPTDPVSRVYACSPSGGSASTAACRAAIAANGTSFVAWDNLRVAGVNGRDRQLIPDGKLCSGGLPAYKGLDLARTDWPSTQLAPGGRLTMTYASTIAHTGTFKLYLTKPGYDPAEPLRWSDLPAQPFAQVTDPALTNGAYHITAKLPSDRTGRQVLYTIWQNSSTPDTYYSCSDVVLTKSAKASGGAAGPAKKRESAGPSRSAEPSPSTPSKSAAAPSAPAAAGTAAAPQSAEGTTTDSTPVASDTATGSGPSAPLVAGGAAAVLVLTGGAALVLRLRRR
ncbi:MULTISPECIES: lytic polysaccharide monooxygenase [Streptomyces]|uniref:lytic polysaccharide monooxygenase n=1 Tax=Streptomyces TaxID=1883 RepID=UPI0029305D65|nr:lytic polysaccharide monooxygenase [Streptomyces sp. NEAU-HV9]